MVLPTDTGSSTSKHHQRRPWKASFPYETDYNDHFETPDVAYQDVAVLLDWINSAKAKGTCNKTSVNGPRGNRSDLILYDPYYCQGRTAQLFRDLDFTSIIHEKRDFYHDIESNQVPNHDVIITNPPYSDQHKKQCLDFCWEQLIKHNRPFCLLLPAYVAARQYYRQLLQDNDTESKVIYLIPNQHYQYDHPEGTGKAESPFDSLWFCGLPSERSTRLQQFIDLAAKAGKFRVAQSLAELEELELISTQTRPNPRQRRKKRKAALGDTGPEEHNAPKSRPPEAPTKNPNVVTETSKPSNKKSKYRDQGGKRIKGRF